MRVTSASASAANDASSAPSSRAAAEVAPRGVELAGGGDDRRELGEAAAEGAGAVGVGVDGRVGQRLLDLAVLGEQLRQPARVPQSPRQCRPRDQLVTVAMR